jgi:hypothetical protein
LKDLINTLVLAATIAAIYWGPIKAVKITRDADERREKTRREFAIFADMMRTRRTILDPLHVSALNLIEVEFHDNQKIVTAYRAYLAYLNQVIPPDQAAQEKFFRDREDVLFDLIHSIGEHLHFAYDKRDLRKFAYAPQGWQNDEAELRTFRRLVIELLNGHRALPVKPFAASDVNEKFPPPP